MFSFVYVIVPMSILQLMLCKEERFPIGQFSLHGLLQSSVHTMNLSDYAVRLFFDQ